MPPQKLGKYQVLEELGRGGYGTVYRAMDTALEVERAVKVLHPALVADPTFIERFRREAKFAARMKHAHIVPVYDLDEAGGRYYLAMEYRSGGSLKDKLEKEGPLPFERAVEIADQIADALDHIHKRELIHRDVKPGNILFDEKGSTALGDLGFGKALSGATSASLSASGGLIGTPAYMAPETWMGEEACPATDVYSLACVFVEMLTGKSLFGGEGDSPPPLVMKRHFDPLELPENWPEGVPKGVNDVLEKALAKEPGERYRSAVDFIEALIAVSRQRSAVSGQPSADSRQPSGISPDSRKLPALSEVEGKADRSPPKAESQKPTAPSPWQHWGTWAGAAGVIALILALVLGNRSPDPEVIVETVLVEGSTAIHPAATKSPKPTQPAPTNAPALEVDSTQVSAVDDMVQVYVPEGEFLMGSEDGDSDESPAHNVTLDAYWIDQHEVSNAQFAIFIEETNYETDAEQRGSSYIYVPEGRWESVESADWQHPQGPSSDLGGLDDHPVVHVSWNDAQAYCQWAGRRLPSEAEWEKAARGENGLIYPWGDDFDCSKGNFDDETIIDDYVNPGGEGCDGYNRTAPVGSFVAGASPYGVLDMAGNVWEWVADWYDVYPGGDPNADDDFGQEYRVLRGGSWYDLDYSDIVVRAALRFGLNPGYTDFIIGFRCARSP